MYFSWIYLLNCHLVGSLPRRRPPPTSPSCQSNSPYQSSVVALVTYRKSPFSTLSLLQTLTLNPQTLPIPITATTMATAGTSTFSTRYYRRSRYLLERTVFPSAVRSPLATGELVISVTRWWLSMRRRSCHWSEKMLVEVLRIQFSQYVHWFHCWMVIMTSLASLGKIIFEHL